jgi:hypothetical protein
LAPGSIGYAARMDTKHIAPIVRSAVEKVEPSAARVTPVVRSAVGHAVERAVEHGLEPAAQRFRPVVQSAVDSAVGYATDVAEPATKRLRPAIRRQRRARQRRVVRTVILIGIALSAGVVVWSVVRRRAAQRDVVASDHAMADQPVQARREPPPAVVHTG